MLLPVTSLGTQTVPTLLRKERLPYLQIAANGGEAP